MLEPRLPNIVSGSVLTLPICLFVGAAMWLLADWETLGWKTGAAFAIVGIVTYMLMEMNNRNALIRIRTRITSSVYWLGMSALIYAQTFDVSLIVPLLMVIALTLLYSTYDDRDVMVQVFHLSICLGVIAVLCHPLILLVPVFWLYLIIYMRAWSIKSFCSSLIGLAVVLGCSVWSCIAFGIPEAPSEILLSGDLHVWLMSRVELWNATMSALVVTPVTVGWCITFLWGAVSASHYVHQSYDDKIRVRMMNYVLVMQWLVLQAIACLMPWRVGELLPVMWLSVAPLVGHQFAVDRSVWNSVWFVTSVLTLAACYVLEMVDVDIITGYARTIIDEVVCAGEELINAKWR